MKLEWDEKSNIIRIGKAEWKRYQNFKNATAWAFAVCEMNDINVRKYKTQFRVTTKTLFMEGIQSKYSHKERSKALGDLFGCSISVLFKHFMALQAKAFITPVYPLYKKLVEYKPWNKGKGWDANVLAQVNVNKELLQPVYNDGLHNILPVVNALKKSPQQLKATYGNTWKAVANNSLSKNKKLMSVYRYCDEDRLKVVFSSDIPSTLIPLAASLHEEVLLYLKKNFKGSWKDKKKMLFEGRLYSDSIQLAEQLGKKVNPKWSPRRMKEEHGKMIQEFNARKYSADVFEWTKGMPKRIEHLGYVAALLDSRRAIADEGTAMGHCVAGYAEESANGNYLVYSVTKDGERSSTIGIHRPRHYDGGSFVEDKHWQVQQHYGRFNARVDDEAEKAIAKRVIGDINELLSTACG